MGQTHKATRHFHRRTVNDRSSEVTSSEYVTETAVSGYALDFGSPYGMVSNAAWQMMKKQKFTASDYELLGYFCQARSYTDHGLVVLGTKQELATAAEMSLRSVQRSLKKLQDTGIIYHDGKGSWWLNPRWLFNGKGEAHFYALKKVPRGVPDLFPTTSYHKGRQATEDSIGEDTWQRLRAKRDAA